MALTPEDLKKPCEIHWCKPRFKSHEYNLRSIKGKCLEGVGIPDGGRAIINHTILPEVGDLVHCNDAWCSINGYIKQVKSFDGKQMVVGTKYLDSTKDFEFYCFEYYGLSKWFLICSGILFTEEAIRKARTRNEKH